MHCSKQPSWPPGLGLARHGGVEIARGPGSPRQALTGCDGLMAARRPPRWICRYDWRCLLSKTMLPSTLGSCPPAWSRRPGEASRASSAGTSLASSQPYPITAPACPLKSTRLPSLPARPQPRLRCCSIGQRLLASSPTSAELANEGAACAPLRVCGHASRMQQLVACHGGLPIRASDCAWRVHPLSCLRSLNSSFPIHGTRLWVSGINSSRPDRHHASRASSNPLAAASSRHAPPPLVQHAKHISRLDASAFEWTPTCQAPVNLCIRRSCRPRIPFFNYVFDCSLSQPPPPLPFPIVLDLHMLAWQHIHLSILIER